jgi:hypothetical protein
LLHSVKSLAHRLPGPVLLLLHPPWGIPSSKGLSGKHPKQCNGKFTYPITRSPDHPMGCPRRPSQGLKDLAHPIAINPDLGLPSRFRFFIPKRSEESAFVPLFPIPAISAMCERVNSHLPLLLLARVSSIRNLNHLAWDIPNHLAEVSWLTADC